MAILPNINPNNSFVNGLSHFKNPQAVLPTLLIEACCTTGRTHQSYKRGGTLEAKERFREEATSAVFWLWGVKALNKIGDFLGEKIFKIKDITDTGKDALRDPGCIMSNRAKVFKFGKIISSVVIATGLIGFVVPKINHAITANALKKHQKNDNQNPNISFENFLFESQKQNSDKYSTKSGQIPFRGNESLTNFIMKASYNLENNNKWRLISTDTGMIAGRIHNSRHPAEALEYGFRDISSILFYNFTTGWLISALNKLSKTTNIHPKALANTGAFITEKLGSGSLKPDEFLEKFIKKSQKAPSIIFEADKTVTVRNLLQQLSDIGITKETDRKLIKKTLEMSHLQPKLRGERILSEQQVTDIFSDAHISNPKFLKQTINEATYGRAANPKKFVSRGTTESIRNSIDEYCRWIAKYAEKQNIKIDSSLVSKLTKRSLRRTAAFQAAGMAFSAFGLAIIIPKMQIFLSQKVFGKKSFLDIAQGKIHTKNQKDGAKKT